MSILRKIRRSEKNTTPYQNVKYVSFDVIKNLSDQNLNRFNQNVDYASLEKNYNDLNENDFELIRVLDHYHFQGQPVPRHYRCMVRHPKVNDFLLQDVSILQWDSLIYSNRKI